MSNTVRSRRRLRAAVLASLSVLLVALAAGPSVAGPPAHAGPPSKGATPAAENKQGPPAHAKKDRDITVMTRNLYLGATLEPLFNPPPTTPEQLVAAATQLWHQVQFTDFPRRAQALAAEIAEEKPDLIGLQEVTLYRVGTPGDPASATQVRLDFLDELLRALAQRGQRYEVASSQAAFDGELTAFDWAPPAGTGGLIDVRLTDRDVILARKGPETANIKVSNAQGGLYENALVLPVLGQPLRIDRGWTSVDVKHRGRSFRLINTHLEAFAQPIAQLQAQELLTSGPVQTDLPVVLVGDFNSAPGEAAYQAIRAAGFTDVGEGSGPTCCYDDALADPSAQLDTRIDLVFTRGPIKARAVKRVGVRLFQAQPPLWASDHAGVVAELILD